MTSAEAAAAEAIGGSDAPLPRLSWTRPGLEDAVRAAAQAVRDARTIVVVAHRHPDGDAVGSSLGAALVCEAAGATVEVVNRDPIPDELAFLPGAGAVRKNASRRPDLTIQLDCTGRERTGFDGAPRVWGRRVLVLDHHRTIKREGIDILVHDESAAATAELVYRLAAELDVALTPAIATCLLAALHTDTGSFRYGCTTAGTMELATHLLSTGIDVWQIASRIYECQRPQRVALLGEVLRTLEVTPDGRLASLVVTADMLAQTGASTTDADGVINHARSVRGVEVAAQFTQDGPIWRISLRSRGRVDVAAVAEKLGGGGHHNAAGCRTGGSIDDARRALALAMAEVEKDGDGA